MQQLNNDEILFMFSGIRGFEQMIQGEESVKEELVKEYRDTKNKVVSYYNVRNNLLTNSFSFDSLNDFISTTLRRNGSSEYTYADETFDLLQKVLCEKIIRDHVPQSAVSQFEKATMILYNKYDQNVQTLLEKIGNYIREERPKFSHIFKKALTIIDESQEKVKKERLT